MEIDATKDMSFGNSDDEFLPITKCKCGKTFNYWEFSISIYKENPTECPNCKRKFYFKSSVTILEVVT